MFTQETFLLTLVCIAACLLLFAGWDWFVQRDKRQPERRNEEYEQRRMHDWSETYFSTRHLFTPVARECLATALGLEVLEGTIRTSKYGITFRDLAYGEDDPLRCLEYLTDLDAWDLFVMTKLEGVCDDEVVEAVYRVFCKDINNPRVNDIPDSPWLVSRPEA